MQLHNQPTDNQGENEPFNFAKSFSFENVLENVRSAENEFGLFDENRKIEYIYFSGGDLPEKFAITLQYENSENIQLCDIRQMAFIIFGASYTFMLSTVYSMFQLMAQNVESENFEEKDITPDVTDFVHNVLKLAIFKSFYLDVYQGKFFILDTEIQPLVSDVINIEPVANHFAAAKKAALEDGFDVDNIVNV